MASNIKTIRKLQMAINTNCDYKILYQTTQFYSARQNRPVTKYILKKAEYNPNTDRTESEEVFSTYSQLQIILYLRDYWCAVQGTEIPTDNEMWNDIKKRDNITFKDVMKHE